jgi:hypothetical protein
VKKSVDTIKDSRYNMNPPPHGGGPFTEGDWTLKIKQYKRSLKDPAAGRGRGEILGIESRGGKKKFL